MKKLWILIALSIGGLSAAVAQSFCASDGQAMPVRLTEQFINADCLACWNVAPPRTRGPQELALDWIVPGSQGDEAPLSAAASRDALSRLTALNLSVPQGASQRTARIAGSRQYLLRVAHGVPLGGYIGASIELKIPKKMMYAPHLSAWLLLVETVPAGTEGSTVERKIVRNTLNLSWDKHRSLSKLESAVFQETRPLSIPHNANIERLSVVGWVQDPQGRTLTAAQSVCAATQNPTEPQTR